MGAFSRKRLRERFITFASAVYNVWIRGCKRYPWRTHVFAFKVDQIGPGGCSALQGWMQCTASEMGKTGTEIASPILDKRIGRRDSPHTCHCSPLDTSAEPLHHTQGDALGYVLIAPSGRALNACAYSLIQLAKLKYKRI